MRLNDLFTRDAKRDVPLDIPYGTKRKIDRVFTVHLNLSSLVIYSFVFAHSNLIKEYYNYLKAFSD